MRKTETKCTFPSPSHSVLSIAYATTKTEMMDDVHLPRHRTLKFFFVGVRSCVAKSETSHFGPKFSGPQSKAEARRRQES